MRKSIIGVLFGGRSAEHEISLASAGFVSRALDPDKFEAVYIGITKKGEWKRYDGPAENAEESIKDGSWEKNSADFEPCSLKREVDFVFPVLHGSYGEDGCIQGFLETIGIPYGGCGVLASAVSMDKEMFKRLMKDAGLPICRYTSLASGDILKDAERAARKIIGAVGLPCFVKPANMGSSVGISKAKTEEELKAALKEACRYDDKIVAEESIDARELEIAVLSGSAPSADVSLADGAFNGETGLAGRSPRGAVFSDVGEIIPSDEFYDYRAKYLGGCRPSGLVIPAAIDGETRKRIVEIAAKAYEAVGGYGFGRIDFFMERATGRIYINEINTIPGFTEHSMFPLLWKNSGLAPRQMIERIIDSGYERYHAENNR